MALERIKRNEEVGAMKKSWPADICVLVIGYPRQIVDPTLGQSDRLGIDGEEDSKELSHPANVCCRGWSVLVDMLMTDHACAVINLSPS